LKPADTISTDFLVVGAGVAGLRAAIELAAAGSVLILAKDRLQESSSEYAQGGIAAALSDDDEVELHEADTLAAGDGLCNPEAVRVLVEEGPHSIEELISWGAQFDRDGSKLLFAREGAHSRRRVLHAHGDSTGKEIARTLYQKAASLEQVRFLSFTAITDLFTADGQISGAVAFEEAAGRMLHIGAKAVLLATGGLGRVYEATTNPDVATGDGVGMAWRAGAEISDIEFVQFHPTALKTPGAPCFLLSEALRGEGAHLRNAAGERFMERYHSMGDLAPRDVVSRSIVEEMQRTGDPAAYLDMTHFSRDFIHTRFPRIYETCLRYGVDLAEQPAPVHPAAHYAMGGVRTDLDGCTNLPRLYAAGEVACTGVHGANRLASNSLLEGVVYGARAGKAMREWALRGSSPAGMAPEILFPDIPEAGVRQLAWRRCGIVRSGGALAEAVDTLDGVAMNRCTSLRRELFEVRNIHAVALLIARCALARKESRGAHSRIDFPDKLDEYARHSIYSLNRVKVEFA
jgi:L-aspartate oxidase